jgi:hypothetical protein
MRSSVLRILAVSTCLALGLTLAPLGCKKDMTELQVPAEGLTLRYALQAGATFDGKVERQETLAARDGRFTRTLKFTVRLAVLSVDESGNAQVKATVSNIAIDWTIPDYPVSMDEFNANAKKILEGVGIPFTVDPQGRITEVPPPPAGLDEATVGVLDSVIEGLTSAFYVLPEDVLTAGETWDAEDTRGREGKLGKYVEETTHGALIGLFEKTETKQKLAQLQIDQDRNETTTTKSGSSSTRVRSKTTVLFDVDGDYITSIDSTMTSTQGPNTTTTDFLATWTQASAGGGAVAPTPQVQKISDPCSDDYVGPDDCLDPCNSNYMGEEPCPSAESSGGGESTTGESTTGESSDETSSTG